MTARISSLFAAATAALAICCAAPAAADPFSQGDTGAHAAGDTTTYFENDNWVPLIGRRTVLHCSSYGCRTTKRFSFTQADLFELALIMATALDDDTPASERAAVRKAIAWMEKRVGTELGTDRDSASISFFSAGRPSQQDCVDEARNTSGYLHVLHAHGLIKHHTRPIIVSRGNMLRGTMTHYGVLMKEASGAVWAVDSGVGGNGALPLIEPARRWYARGRSTMPRRLFWG